MHTVLNLVVPPEVAGDDQELRQYVANELEISAVDITAIRPVRRSIDARQRTIKINLRVEVWYNEPAPAPPTFTVEYPNVADKPEVIIVGFGPAGMFAALQLINLGYKPVVLERGKDVRSRRRDLKAINQDHEVNPDSNYCFGEGGAGTYSDGKLYTRSKKRGKIEGILHTLVAHGATEDILVDAHPHIGTNKLPDIVVAMRESIINAGGEVHFDTRVADFIVEDSAIKGVVTAGGDRVTGKAVILATGHSARDIFELLHKSNILIEAKPFAMGVRVEHPQDLIDSLQYHCERNAVGYKRELLPAAPYSVVHQAKGRGVFSFCMCPGGFIVPAATAPGEVVVNGMSPSKRDSKFANSGIVVGIELEDLAEWQDHGPLAGLRYQQHVERLAWEAGGQRQSAPAQRLEDFVAGRNSRDLPETSYQPGIVESPLHEVLPDGIGKRLQKGFRAFGFKMNGYLTNEAVIVGVESRTSSPVRIPRENDTLEHPQISCLYPCGEGAGYAGGIVSAAMDGERIAKAIAEKFA